MDHEEKKQGKHCPTCETPYEPDSESCAKCAELISPNSKVVSRPQRPVKNQIPLIILKCRKCSQPVDLHAKYCFNCGSFDIERPGDRKKKAQVEPKPKLDCSVCKTEKAMAPRKISKFGNGVQLLGALLIVLSILGMIVGGFLGLVFLLQFQLFLAVILGVVTCTLVIVGIIIGAVLHAERKVYRCDNCGFILERS